MPLQVVCQRGPVWAADEFLRVQLWHDHVHRANVHGWWEVHSITLYLYIDFIFPYYTFFCKKQIIPILQCITYVKKNAKNTLHQNKLTKMLHNTQFKKQYRFTLVSPLNQFSITFIPWLLPHKSQMWGTPIIPIYLALHFREYNIWDRAEGRPDCVGISGGCSARHQLRLSGYRYHYHTAKGNNSAHWQRWAWGLYRDGTGI